MADALAKFLETVERVKHIRELADSARQLPRRYARDVSKVPVYRRDYYSSSDAPEPAIQAVINAKAAAEEAERRRGEQERDEKLRALANEIDALRAVLPGLAAGAAIDLGAVARGMRGGSDG